MKVKVTYKPRPKTKPHVILTKEIECESVERNYQACENGPKWAFFKNKKETEAMLESMIVKIEMEEF